MSIRDRLQHTKQRWQTLRQLGGPLRPLDANDRVALAFLVNSAGEALRDGNLSREETELLREAIEALREARADTP